MTGTGTTPSDDDLLPADESDPSTARQLRRKALLLVADRGLSNVTVADIAEAANVSVKTFYEHFQSKEAALFGMDPEEARMFRRRVVFVDPTKSAFDTLRIVIADHANTFIESLGDEQLEWIQRVRSVGSDPNVRATVAARTEMIQGAMRDGIAERLGTDPKQDPYPALIAAMAITAYRFSMLYWSDLGGRVPINEVVNLTFDAMAAGVPEDCQLRDLKGA